MNGSLLLPGCCVKRGESNIRTLRDPQYFNKQFRKVAGISPNRYREENSDYLDSTAVELAAREGRWES